MDSIVAPAAIASDVSNSQGVNSSPESWLVASAPAPTTDGRDRVAADREDDHPRAGENERTA